MGGTVKVRGLEIVVQNFNNIPAIKKAQILAAAKEANQLLYDKVRELAGLTDHTLKQLSAMGHPYARYWSEDSGPHPDEYVHRQSSNLYDNIEQVVKMDGNMVISAVGVDEKKVEYIGYLIWGTVFMRSRDFLGHAWVAVRNPFMKILQYGLSSKTGSRGSKR